MIRKNLQPEVFEDDLLEGSPPAMKPQNRASQMNGYPDPTPTYFLVYGTTPPKEYRKGGELYHLNPSSQREKGWWKRWRKKSAD